MMAGLAIGLAGGCAHAVEKPAEMHEPRGPVAVSAPASGDARYAPAWINTDRRPIGPLTAIGSTVVGMVVEDRRLFVIAIDPATGHELWHQPATPGAVTAGVTVHVEKIGVGNVAYFRPVAKNDYAQLVVADAQSGRDLAVSPPAWFTAHPFACINGQDACVLSSDGEGGKIHAFRLEVATGKYLTDSPYLPPDTRLLASPGLIDLGDRPGNTLGWLHDGKLQWTVPVSAAFPRGSSSDYGWAWNRFADQHVVVGSVYGPPLAMSPRLVVDLERGATVGLSEETGEVRWRDIGSSFLCHLGGEHDCPVRCRRRGTATYQPDGSPSFDGLDVAVEGFDPTTGVTTWSVPMGPTVSLVSWKASIPIAGPTEVVVNRPTGPVVMDYATGNVTPPPTGATFWCTTNAQYELPRSVRALDGKRHYERPGGPLAAICDALGNRSDALPGLEATLAVGAHVGSHIVIATPDGYLGYEVR